MYGKIKQEIKHIKTNFDGQDVPFDVYSNTAAISKVDSVYKKRKTCHHQVYVEE